MANDGMETSHVFRRLVKAAASFSIFHLIFVIDGISSMRNGKWKIKNGKWQGALIACGAVPIIVRFVARSDWRLYAYHKERR